MMDTCVDGKGQRIQVMLYAKANWKGILPRAVCRETRTHGSAVGVWGNTPVARPEGAPCAYYNRGMV